MQVWERQVSAKCQQQSVSSKVSAECEQSVSRQARFCSAAADCSGQWTLGRRQLGPPSSLFILYLYFFFCICICIWNAGGSKLLGPPSLHVVFVFVLVFAFVFVFVFVFVLVFTFVSVFVFEMQRAVNSWAPPARPFLPPLFISSFFRFPPRPFFQFFNCSFELCFAPVLMSEVSFCRLAPIVLVFIFSGGKTETATAAERSGQWTLGRRAAGLTQLFSFSFAEFQPQNFSKMFL